MSEEEEVLWETSARHLCFRCFFSQNFLTRLIADPRGFSEQAFFFFFQIHTAAGAFFAIRAGFSVPQSVLSLRRAPPSSRKKASRQFHTLLNKENDKNSANELRDACVLTPV